MMISKQPNELRPKNYASYAGRQYQKNPDITQEQIRNKMQTSNNRVTIAQRMFEGLFEFVVNAFT